jgi:hypothetical protein
MSTVKTELVVASTVLPSPLTILDAACRGGITAENVAVVKELAAMCREQQAAESKSAFNRDFFRLKQEINTLHLYADKEAKSRDGTVMYSYCSETELSEKLEPVLDRHHFSMLFSQERSGDTVTALITLIHEAGHEHISRYTVRVGPTNAAKDATAADAGSTTSAWRHLVMKMFGLKSRITEGSDPRLLGETVTPEQAEEMQHRAKMVNAKEFWLLKMGGVTPATNTPTLDDYKQLKSGSYLVLDNFLKEKEKQGK